MSEQQKIQFNISSFNRIDESNAAIEQKLNELEVILSSANINSDQLIYYKKKIDETFDKNKLNKNIHAYQQLDELNDISTGDRLDQLINLLAENPVDSNIIHKHDNVFFVQKNYRNYYSCINDCYWVCDDSVTSATRVRNVYDLLFQS